MTSVGVAADIMAELQARDAFSGVEPPERPSVVVCEGGCGRRLTVGRRGPVRRFCGPCRQRRWRESS